MTMLRLTAPLAGWAMPLPQVPDPVFAGRLAGDGVAIDPTGCVLHAPCAGEIVPMQGASHALTIRSQAGVDILLHLGIDTVNLKGEGFDLLVKPGEQVITGQALLRFDLDLIVRRARSAATPILLASEGIIRRRSEDCAVEIGDFLMEIEVGAAATVAATPLSNADALNIRLGVPFDHGLHARPAALIASTLKPFAADVMILSRGRQANARSPVAMMALGIAHGETIEVHAVGADAAKAIQALETLLTQARTETAPAARPAARVLGETRRVKAVIASRGIAIGQAVQMARPEFPVAEAGAGARAENQAFHTAINIVKVHIESLASSSSGEQFDILSAHAELIQDPELTRQAVDWIGQGKSAGYAWRQATRTMVAALDALDDERMRARTADLRDIEEQVLRVLAGESPSVARQLPVNAIIIADELLPSQLVALDRTRIAGICTARGGATSHVAIIAAAMGIPALVAAGELVLDIAEGTAVVLDAEQGVLDIAPAAETLADMEKTLAIRKARHAVDLAAAKQECVTFDQVRIAVYANLGEVSEAAPAVELGAEGCGLLRTEFMFLDRREPPDENEQAGHYQAIATALAGRPLTIRTLDIGGDKPIAYLPLPHEDNPALGLRGLRTSLWRPELMRTQLRAILRVTPTAQCRILLPMVTDAGDIQVVRELLKETGREMGIADTPALGIMIETPASALLADQLIRDVDFLSIGTNDLSQYTLAMDRGHPELASRLDGLHPAVLRLIQAAAKAGHDAGKEVAVCGGLGSDVSALPVLIGLGITEVSAVPASIPRLKRVIRLLDSNACRQLALEALAQPTAPAVRSLVQRWYATTASAAIGD